MADWYGPIRCPLLLRVEEDEGGELSLSAC